MADPLDKPTTAPDLVSAWLEAIEGATTEEKDWQKEGDAAVKSHRGEGDARRFNIYHANVETIVPALYNSKPVPDIRTRFNDDNPVAKAGGEVLERAIGFSIDDYDFDDLIESAVRDMVTVSRGIARIRYRPHFDDTGMVVDEEVSAEYVPWRSFRRGPGRVWADVPWIAFEHFLSRKEVERLVAMSGVPLAADREIPFNYSAAATPGADNGKAAEPPRFGKRARVWEVWDRDERQVMFLCADYSFRPLVVMPDPLGLAQFWPIPVPMRALKTTDCLVPLTSMSIYKDLILELEETTKRIARLIKQMRPRGGYASQFATLEKIAAADDGELVALEGLEAALSAPGGDLTKLIAWFPLESTARALRELREQREAIKQSIYEVTGLSDIVRGASEAGETATAQQIKTQWGSLRIQRMQAEVARFARDLFRLKAEVMSKHVGFDVLLRMAGMEDMPPVAVRDAARQKIAMAVQMAAAAPPGMPPGMAPPGAPPAPPPDAADMKIAEGVAREEVEQMLRGSSRSYRIDIESDSTIRGDLARNQREMTGFIQGTGMYLQAIGPAIMQGAMPKTVAIEIFAAFARSFKLGKQAEDALSAWADDTKKEGQGGQAGSGQPDPGVQKAAAEAERAKADEAASAAKTQGQAQIISLKDQAAQREHERTMQLADRDDASIAARATLGPVKTVDVGQQVGR